MSDGAIVYVVDDDPSVRKATARLLRTAGFNVELFRSADEFLEHPDSELPGCVILDLEMPGRSGIAQQANSRDWG